MRLKNKVAIVTGAAMGIGYGIAEKLLNEGAKVIFSDIKGSEALVKKFKNKAIFIKCDVSNQVQVNKLIKHTINKFGKLDILVNNAGIFPFVPFMQMQESDWNKVMNVNLKSIFFTSQAAAKVMTKGGKIINISSIASMVGFPSLTHYCASKSGMNGFVRALALELAPQKITVNAVAPGAIETLGASQGSSEEATKQTINIIPLKRMGQPADIASAVAFLASADADYITGQIITVDGGWIIQ